MTILDTIQSGDVLVARHSQTETDIVVVNMATELGFHVGGETRLLARINRVVFFNGNAADISQDDWETFYFLTCEAMEFIDSLLASRNLALCWDNGNVIVECVA